MERDNHHHSIQTYEPLHKLPPSPLEFPTKYSPCVFWREKNNNKKKIVVLGYCCITGNNTNICRRDRVCILKIASFTKSLTPPLHPVLVLYSKTSILFLPNETVPSDPLPALHISRVFMPLHYGFYQ